MIDCDLPRKLLKASDYRDFVGHWHQGKIHLLKDESEDSEAERTWCGKTLELCPGDIFDGLFEEVTCKVCKNSFIRRDQWKEANARWAEENARRQAEYAEASRQWHLAYNQYLKTPTWRRKRRQILTDCCGRCQGCGRRQAVEVHHKEYPQGVMPGSVEWVRMEKLFMLVALCPDCHTDVHPRHW